MTKHDSGHISDHMSGHRERMKQKCDAKGMASLTDQELFEILLYPLLPRIDTKPIVKECFKKFSNFSGIINAQDAKLLEIKVLILLRKAAWGCSLSSEWCCLPTMNPMKSLILMTSEIALLISRLMVVG